MALAFQQSARRRPAGVLTAHVYFACAFLTRARQSRPPASGVKLLLACVDSLRMAQAHMGGGAARDARRCVRCVRAGTVRMRGIHAVGRAELKV